MAENALGTHLVCQIALVVRDIDRVSEAYSRLLGVPKPPVLLTDPATGRDTYRGAPTQAQAKLAFFDLGQVALELIEPVGAPSVWQEALDARGEGVHHIAFRIRDTDRVTATLAEQGFEIIQQGDYPGGRYTYVDSTATLKTILELLEDFDQDETPASPSA